MIGLLLACSSGPVDVAEETHAFGSPAEAEDLDAADDVLHVSLTAAAYTAAAAKGAGHEDEEATGETVSGYAYNGKVPGPTLRAKVGDTVVVDLYNGLDEATTIHWHGLSVPAEMDGVTWLADPVEPGETFTYTFTVDRPGTYWYHPHLDVSAQISAGLYGAFVVEDPAEPAADEELVLVWQATTGGAATHDDGEDSVHGEDTGVEAAAKAGGDEGHDHASHEVTDPADLLWTANGVAAPTFSPPAGARVRVRMVNAAPNAYLDLRWPGMRQIASDQGLLPALAEPEDLLLAPGDRVEVEWLGDAFAVEGLLHAATGHALGHGGTLLNVAPAGDDPAGAPLDWPFSGEAPSADPGTTAIVYTFTGGADGTWLINGEAWPEVTIETLPAGAEAVIEVRNLSPSEHPFHVHGQRFEVLAVDGVPVTTRAVEDTINVGVLSRVRLRMVPENPGDWMVHCHLVAHEENGMMTVLRVE